MFRLPLPRLVASLLILTSLPSFSQVDCNALLKSGLFDMESGSSSRSFQESLIRYIGSRELSSKEETQSFLGGIKIPMDGLMAEATASFNSSGESSFSRHFENHLKYNVSASSDDEWFRITASQPLLETWLACVKEAKGTFKAVLIRGAIRNDGTCDVILKIQTPPGTGRPTFSLEQAQLERNGLTRLEQSNVLVLGGWRSVHMIQSAAKISEPIRLDVANSYGGEPTYAEMDGLRKPETWSTSKKQRFFSTLSLGEQHFTICKATVDELEVRINGGNPKYYRIGEKLEGTPVLIQEIDTARKQVTFSALGDFLSRIAEPSSQRVFPSSNRGHFAPFGAEPHMQIREVKDGQAWFHLIRYPSADTWFEVGSVLYDRFLVSRVDASAVPPYAEIIKLW